MSMFFGGFGKGQSLYSKPSPFKVRKTLEPCNCGRWKLNWRTSRIEWWCYLIKDFIDPKDYDKRRSKEAGAN